MSNLQLNQLIADFITAEMYDFLPVEGLEFHMESFNLHNNKWLALFEYWILYVLPPSPPSKIQSMVTYDLHRIKLLISVVCFYVNITFHRGVTHCANQHNFRHHSKMS